jgi:adenylate cyclase
MLAPQAHLIHEFGDFELDTMRRVLTSRVDGRSVEITARVMDALIRLVERSGQLIEKRALIEALWPNVVVEDGNLTQTIHTLRRVLGEQAGDHRYIATVPGRGYQFVAEVRTRAAAGAPMTPAAPSAPNAPAAPPAPTAPAASTTPGAPPSHRLAWLLPTGVLAVVLIGVVAVFTGRHELPVTPVAVNPHPTIAVLPFVDMSDEQDQMHFAEGLSEEILNLLAHADNLRVTARTSSFSFKGENADIKTIAHRLDVAYVLEGSVRKASDHVRITAQLIDASTSAHLWSDTYDRDVHDILGVQREIATAVAGALRVTLAHEGPRRAETASIEAYEHFLQGRFLFSRRSPGDLLQAKAHFDEAVRIDPSYARAWAGLAGVYFVAKYEPVSLPDAMKNWSHAVERAIASDPGLAEGHMRAAQYYWLIGKQDTANAELARAVALDPQDPLVLGAIMSEYISDGRIAEAVEVQRRIVALDPLSASSRSNLGAFLTVVGRLDEAQAELERALELSPAAPAVLTAIADVLILQKRTDEALDVISRMPEGYQRDQRRAIVDFGRGRTAEGNEILQRFEAAAKKPDSDRGVAFAIAEVYAARADTDRAFDWLVRALRPSGPQSQVKPCWAILDEMQTSVYLGPLRTDPRWDDLVKTAKACPN